MAAVWAAPLGRLQWPCLLSSWGQDSRVLSRGCGVHISSSGRPREEKGRGVGGASQPQGCVHFIPSFLWDSAALPSPGPMSPSKAFRLTPRLSQGCPGCWSGARGGV